MVASPIDTPARQAPRFYVWVAIGFAAIAFGAFSETYWLQLPAGTFRGEPIVHLHAVLFSAWLLFFLSQTTLAARGQLTAHRAWGMAGIALATAMVLVGLAAAIASMKLGLAHGYGDRSRAFLIVPISSVLTFAAFVIAAIANVARPEWHKRFMVVAAASLLQAAFARVFFLVVTGGGPGLRPGLGPPPPMFLPVITGMIVAALLALAAAYDWRTRGKPHPAYLIGVAAIVAVALVRGPLAGTALWRAAADFLAAFAR